MSERIKRIMDRGMVSLRADLTDPACVNAVKTVLGLIPDTRKIIWQDSVGIAWMSPDELLVVCSDPAPLIADLGVALDGVHHLVVDVSDARAVFQISGPWRDILSAGAPVDMHPDVFSPGEIRRTRLGQVAAAFWAVDTSTAELICFASVAEFVADWLLTAAREGAEPCLYGP